VEYAEQVPQVLEVEDGGPLLMENKEVRGDRGEKRTIKFRWLN